MRTKSVLYPHKIFFEKVDGTESSELFYSVHENAQDAIQEFLNSRMAVSAWIQ